MTTTKTDDQPVSFVYVAHTNLFELYDGADATTVMTMERNTSVEK